MSALFTSRSQEAGVDYSVFQFLDGRQCIFLFMSKILIWVRPLDLVVLFLPRPPSGIVAQIPSYWPHAMAIQKGSQSCLLSWG